MRLVFAGTPEIAALSLRRLAKFHEIALVITRPDSPVGRKREVRPSAVAQVATDLGLPVTKTNRITATEITAIEESGAQRAVVVAFGALIPQQALDLFPWWNLHFSLLPKWRGATPLQHSMMNADGIGVTIFELEKGLDTGPLISTRPVELGPTETAGEALVRFAELGSELLLEALENNPKAIPQSGTATLAPKISRDEARVDFSQSGVAIARKINALNPEPVAWAQLDGNPIRLLRAKQLGKVNWNEIAESLGRGEAKLLSGRVLVGAGEGTQFELLEVQPAGKKPMVAGDWLRGQSKAVKFD